MMFAYAQVDESLELCNLLQCSSSIHSVLFTRTPSMVCNILDENPFQVEDLAEAC